jgi:hypothetical protein
MNQLMQDRQFLKEVVATRIKFINTKVYRIQIETNFCEEKKNA